MPAVSTLTELITALLEIEQEMMPGSEPYALRPKSINPPAIYNHINPSQAEGMDTAMNRDLVVVGVRIVAAYAEAPGDGLDLIGRVDQGIAVLDAALKDRGGPLGGARARRIGITPFSEQFDTISVQGFELPVRVDLDRIVPPTL